jgi:hypothetical protein
MRSVETILGIMWGGKIKENGEGGEFNYDLLDIL